MPESIPIACPIPGCLATNCVVHSKLGERARGSSSARGYNGAWRRLRSAFLSQRCSCDDDGMPPLTTCPLCHGGGLVHSLCEECLDAGILIRATEVDHVIPWLNRPELRLNPQDLSGLCSMHHNRKSAAEKTGGALSEFQKRQRARVTKELDS